MKRIAAVLLLLAALAPGARAIMAPKGAVEDAKRFGLDHAQAVQRKAPSASSRKAFQSYNSATGGRWRIRFNPRTGLPNSIYGGKDLPRPGLSADAAARAYLAAHADVLGVDPSILTVEKQTKGNGHQHLLYRQSYKGIPVEFAAVKMHLDMHGAVIGVASTYEPDINVPTTPKVAAGDAARAARADVGSSAKTNGKPSLVVVPLESDGLNHLAWKMRVDGSGNSWRYYVDAITGQVLFRYGVLEFQSPPCLSSGVVTGLVFDVDPTSTPGPVIRPFLDQYVYVGSPPTQVLTETLPAAGSTPAIPGFFCAPVFGKVAMSLQGPWVSVSEFRGPSAHYDDGSGVWTTVPTPLSSPHPYPGNANIVNTINLGTLAPSAVEFLPVFEDFAVGGFDGGSGEGSGDIIDDDKLFISDQYNNRIAEYIGARGGFNGAAVHGTLMNLTLGSNDEDDGEAGYDIAVSSYLTLSNPNSDGAPYSSHQWTSTDTWISGVTGSNIHGEISLFYHLNLMHDYFMSDVDQSSAAAIDKPEVAMAHVGPNLQNAFYDPDYDDLSFGDNNTLAPSDAFMDDATVPHHEYTHYVVQKIWNLQNFGQAGTLSEANADYWSASSLNDSFIGNYVVDALGGVGPLRQIDDTALNSQFYNLANASGSGPGPGWTGEIHLDSPFLSQALWDIRRFNIGSLGQAKGVSCANGLVFQSLLYFPESFGELYDDMLQVASLNIVPNCAGADTNEAAYIYNSFSAHGLIPVGGDAYEPDDGFESAVDISTLGIISATIYPIADVDFYSFGAGPGLVQITMNLPSNNAGLFEDYQLRLYDVAHNLVATAEPPANGFGTVDGTCDSLVCTTTSPSVKLSYNNPSGSILYVEVCGGTSYDGSNSGVSSTLPYTLTATYQRSGALSGAVVSARFDNDAIGFAVNTSTFGNSVPNWNFASAQLHDQVQNVMPGTLTHVPALTSDWLSLVSSQTALGQISGSVKITPGFATRFPSVGTVYLEVFGYDVLGSTESLGLSNPVTLSDSSVGLTAYNNLFNPMLGQQTTIQYGVNASGRLTIKVYTSTGRLVFTLFDGEVAAGKGSMNWNGQNAAGSFVASGIYVVRAVGPGLNTTQKIAVIK